MAAAKERAAYRVARGRSVRTGDGVYLAGESVVLDNGDATFFLERGFLDQGDDAASNGVVTVKDGPKITQVAS